MSKHTAPPWNFDTVKTSCGICHRIGPFPYKLNEKPVHACVYVDYPGNGDIEAELLANARLMATAPELLDALIGLDEAFCSINEFSTKQERHDARLKLIAARAAIAKATGAA